MSCKRCKSAYKSLNVIIAVLKTIWVVSVGTAAATKQTSAALMGIVCYTASTWLARYVYKTFHYHDYDHALR